MVGYFGLSFVVGGRCGACVLVIRCCVRLSVGLVFLLCRSGRFFFLVFGVFCFGANCSGCCLRCCDKINAGADEGHASDAIIIKDIASYRSASRATF